MSAKDLIANIKSQLTPQPPHFLTQVEAASLPSASLWKVVVNQRAILASDHISFLTLAKRFPAASDFFEFLAAGELHAMQLLERFATQLGEEPANLEPHPLAQCYPHYLSWLAAQGTLVDVLVAMVTNLEEWGLYCRRLAAALRDGYRLEDVEFFAFFGADSGLEEKVLPLLEEELRKQSGAQVATSATQAAKFLHRYEGLFWESLLT
ncbi:uncharacterized protein VTP21DRAFT_10578 [Calcarisporiella thermophila]|uniref:uncharacterized protein n=1 Tax=Calcarisporiella thermophila TaxID=911321 RepID=UPI0037430ECD